MCVILINYVTNQNDNNNNNRAWLHSITITNDANKHHSNKSINDTRKQDRNKRSKKRNNGSLTMSGGAGLVQ